MPIRPENVARYPKNWKSEVVPRIRARSGNRCECTGQCGVSHNNIEDDRCNRLNGEVMLRREGGGLMTVVLTVMHLNHQPEDCSDENLLHGCQRCHNCYDAPMRRAGIAARARAQRASGDLFTCQETT